MLLEEGKKYITRNGLTTEPLVINKAGGNYIFESELQEPRCANPSYRSWLKDGSFISPLSGHPLDLIK